MRSCPPQYPRSSTSINPFPSLFLLLLFLYFLPSFFSPFSPSFPPLSFCPFFVSYFILSRPSLFVLGFLLFFADLSTFFIVCVRACVCVSLTYVRAYLAIPCVSADDNVKHTKSNIRYDNKILKNETNVKYIRIHVYEYTERMFAGNLSHRDRNPKYSSKL